VEVLFVALSIATGGSAGDNFLMRTTLFIVAAVPLLSGCVVETVAKTAVDVATVPVKVAAAGVNAVLPSQRKADEKRGREMRREDEERGKQVRLAAERCRKGKPLPGDPCGEAAPR
jgi:hypothetical protein